MLVDTWLAWSCGRHGACAIHCPSGGLFLALARGNSTVRTAGITLAIWISLHWHVLPLTRQLSFLFLSSPFFTTKFLYSPSCALHSNAIQFLKATKKKITISKNTNMTIATIGLVPGNGEKSLFILASGRLGSTLPCAGSFSFFTKRSPDTGGVSYSCLVLIMHKRQPFLGGFLFLLFPPISFSPSLRNECFSWEGRMELSCLMIRSSVWSGFDRSQ